MIETIDISDECYIEVIHHHHVYTYTIAMELDFDFFDMYYWAPAKNVSPTGLHVPKRKLFSLQKKL